MEEIWKDVKNYEGKYLVSNLGNIKSLIKNGRILKSFDDGNGYLKVKLVVNRGKFKNERVHRLVAEAFIPNIDNLPYINHKNENRKDNNINNLEWCTRKYNNNYGNRIENMKKTFTKIGFCEPICQYDLEGNFVNEFRSINEASKITNINDAYILGNLKGKYKRTKGYTWKYKKNVDSTRLEE